MLSSSLSSSSPSWCSSQELNVLSTDADNNFKSVTGNGSDGRSVGGGLVGWLLGGHREHVDWTVVVVAQSWSSTGRLDDDIYFDIQ